MGNAVSGEEGHLGLEKRLELIARVTATAHSTASLSDQLESLCVITAEAFEADACVIRKLEGELLELRAFHGMPDDKLVYQLRANSDVSDQLIKMGQPIRINDANFHASSSSSGSTSRLSYAGAPMISGDRVMGVVGLYTRDEHKVFRDSDLAYLQIIANHVAVMLVNEELVEQLREANEQLDQRVEERTAELRAANEELEEFSYAVAHDLRSPLRSILGFAQVLAEDYGSELLPAVSALIERQTVAARRMSFLIDDLLGLARVGRIHITRTEFDMGLLAKEIWDEVVVGHSTQTKFVYEPDTVAYADRKWCRTIIQNLMENSLKFAKSSEPLILLFGSIRKEGAVTYYLQDNGIGFENEQASRIFKPFERLATRPSAGGSGIGLSTVKRVVERHGGRIWADSAPNQGATFYFTLDPHTRATSRP